MPKKTNNPLEGLSLVGITSDAAEEEVKKLDTETDETEKQAPSKEASDVKSKTRATKTKKKENDEDEAEKSTFKINRNGERIKALMIYFNEDQLNYLNYLKSQQHTSVTAIIQRLVDMNMEKNPTIVEKSKTYSKKTKVEW